MLHFLLKQKQNQKKKVDMPVETDVTSLAKVKKKIKKIKVPNRKKQFLVFSSVK